jgi:hypothetical protein
MAIEYPEGVSKGYHIKISAYKYDAPSFKEAEGGAPSTLAHKRNELGIAWNIYLQGGFTESLSFDWEVEENILHRSEGGSLGDDLLKSLPTLAANGITKSISEGSSFGKAVIGSGSSALGKAPRPFTAKIFKGAGYNSIALDILFAPGTKAEADASVEMINGFRKLAAPEVNTENYVMTYNYPAVFDLQVANGGGGNGPAVVKVSSGDADKKYGFMQYYNMAITGFELSYNNQMFHFAYLPNGMPAEARLSLQFTSLIPYSRKMGSEKTGTDGGIAG